MTKQYIKIPKGTTVYTNNIPGWLVDPQTAKTTISTRDSVVELYCYAMPTRAQSDAQMPKIVMWSNGLKYCLESDVELNVAAPVRKTTTQPSIKKITLRQRLVKNSKWRLTQPATVVKPGNPTPVTNPRGMNWMNYELVSDYDLPVGTELTITGKSTTCIAFPCQAGLFGTQYFSGMWYPVKVAGSKDEIWLQYSELNKNPEVVGEEVKEAIYGIFDPETNQYYAGTDMVYNNGWHSNGVIYAPTIGKAKKFKRLADARVHCLIKTGYYDQLPDTWGSVPDWMMGYREMPDPTTWVIHKIDKATKQVLEVIELVDTFNRSWKLRALTVKYGSAVRQAYSDLEKKNKLGEYSAAIIFKNPTQYYWGEDLTDEDIRIINDVAKAYGGECKVVKTKTSVALAVKDESTATMIALAYTGKIQFAIIDFDTMNDIVQEKEPA